MHNLEVEEDHTYFANGVLVHNCDLFAAQDLHGLGPGGYPLDSIPHFHVSDLCHLVSITDPHFAKREVAKAKGTEEPPKPWLSGKRETSEGWLLSRPKAERLAILGPTRERLLHQGEKMTTRDGGAFRKVHNLLGKHKPQRDMGPKVDATPLVQADRAKMRQQFPALL